MKTYTVIIETPKGSSAKFDYNKKLRCFTLKKVLPAGMQFPFDFGFIPGTKAADGDPIDVVVISDVKAFAGCGLECRIIGVIEAEQSEGNKQIRNDRLLAVPVESAQYKPIEQASQLPAQFLEEVGNFFISYNAAEGKQFKILQVADGKKAVKLIKASRRKRK